MIGGTNPITVRVRFTTDAAYRVLEGGYPNASEPLIHPDGGLELEIRAGADNTGLPRELIPWILSWGPRVECWSRKSCANTGWGNCGRRCGGTTVSGVPPADVGGLVASLVQKVPIPDLMNGHEAEVLLAHGDVL